MNRWMAVAITALAMTTAPLRLTGQERWSAGSRPQGPATPDPGASRPAPPPNVAAPPFRGTLVFQPPPDPDHGPFHLRSSWLGLVLFDPYWVWPSGLDQMPGALPPANASDERPTGGLQLDVEPRRARVYVDGSYVGIVDEFSGYYRHLDLPAGPHRVEFLTPDHDPLFVDVMVVPGRTTTYRGSLNRR